MINPDKKLGCCGYDELAYKPPTTRPMRVGMPARRMRGANDLSTPVRQVIVEKPAVGNMPAGVVTRQLFAR